MVKCPKCGKTIMWVKVYSQCYQIAEVDKKGKITDYEDVENVLETEDIECIECQTSVKHLIKEE